ncbi:glycoside hydrolase family 3 C-terminal domain-containing protein [Yinghuangia aomiensis]|uniref:Glycoside hydrolase family 3 C-terminal domain-containing protein n=1 Tax=Yinghuangia aomiensis TaxID=676205 RepID=A0ABP9HEP9_9ACTN
MPDPAAPPTDTELRALAARLSTDDKLRLITGEDVWSLPALPQIGLRKITMSDGPVGVRGVTFDEGDPSVLVPNPSAQAAAWDPEVPRRAGELLGAQARAKNVDVLLAPTVNLHRTPLGGRHFECYSEDPLLTARSGAAFVAGVQAQGVAATVKHFVANDSEDGRMEYDVRADERTLREAYLVPFLAAVRDAQAWLVMSAYNGVNGHTMTENAPLQTTVLKDEWGFDGVVVSDWMAVRSTEAAYLGGTDIAMPGPAELWGEPLRAALRDGRVDETVLDDKVVRILRLAARVGALGDTAPATPSDVLAHAGERIRDIARRGLVLLANRGALPLDTGKLRRVALIGPNAVRLSAQGGGSAHASPQYVVDVAQGLRAALGPDVELTVRDGAFTHRRLPGLTRDNSVNPVTGAPGVRLDFVDTDGNVLGSEDRVGSQVILWPGLFPAGTAAAVLRTRITPAVDGDNLLDVLGSGPMRLTVDGETRTVDLGPTGDNPMESLMRPPLRRIPVAARAGVPVDIELGYVADGDLVVAGFGLGWGDPRLDDETELREAIADAAAADVAIVVVGTTDDIESEGYDRKDLALPGRSDELVARVLEANPNTVVVVNAGSPVRMPWRDDAAAVLWAWLPGQEGGNAIADVLTGAAEPGGRLPTTFPADEADVPILATTPVDGRHTYDEGPTIGYRLWAARGAKPAYPFGHGLGYTTWEYRNLRIEGDATAGLTVTADVANTGSRPGRETVQVYLEPASGELLGRTEPLRLVGYAPATAAPGEAATVRIPVDADTLARWDADTSGWRVVPGTYRIAVAHSAGDVRLTGTVEL